MYGLKGISAYADHAYILKGKDESILIFLQEALVATLDKNLTADELTALVLKAGQNAVKAMELLDKANTGAYGSPEITEISTGTMVECYLQMLT